MNEKIKELYKQSKPDNWIDLQTLYGELPALSGDQVENFAKLIIKECAEVADSHWETADEYCINQSAYFAIKKHFGVEL